ncbi:tautomerase family protein [Lentzea californiensis]|uniref:tautomerase family protein n=1 Tax=Lentzea californiensis TaxID=438851 RepID=UPI002164E508|nr:tautomerase family protein [Lentzea californiensis]
MDTASTGQPAWKPDSVTTCRHSAKNFRSVAWTYLHELPAGAQTTAEDDAPRFRVDVRVPVGALSDRRKAGLVWEATALVLAAAGLGEADAMRVWVLIHEQPEGTWGAGGQIVKFAELKALAAQG